MPAQGWLVRYGLRQTGWTRMKCFPSEEDVQAFVTAMFGRSSRLNEKVRRLRLEIVSAIQDMTRELMGGDGEYFEFPDDDLMVWEIINDQECSYVRGVCPEGVILISDPVSNSEYWVALTADATTDMMLAILENLERITISKGLVSMRQKL